MAAATTILGSAAVYPTIHQSPRIDPRWYFGTCCCNNIDNGYNTANDDGGSAWEPDAPRYFVPGCHDNSVIVTVTGETNEQEDLQSNDKQQQPQQVLDEREEQTPPPTNRFDTARYTAWLSSLSLPTTLAFQQKRGTPATSCDSFSSNNLSTAIQQLPPRVWTRCADFYRSEQELVQVVAKAEAKKKASEETTRLESRPTSKGGGSTWSWRSSTNWKAAAEKKWETWTRKISLRTTAGLTRQEQQQPEANTQKIVAATTTTTTTTKTTTKASPTPTAEGANAPSTTSAQSATVTDTTSNTAATAPAADTGGYGPRIERFKLTSQQVHEMVVEDPSGLKRIKRHLRNKSVVSSTVYLQSTLPRALFRVMLEDPEHENQHPLSSSGSSKAPSAFSTPTPAPVASVLR